MNEKNSNREKNSKKIQHTVAQTAILMAVLTLFSKLLGFVREMVIAAFFGANYVVDAYVMAQSIPNILFSGILSAVSTSFMPLFSEKMEKEGTESGNQFVNDILNLLLRASICVAIVGIIFAPQFVSIFAPGFEGEQQSLTEFFLRVAFSFLIFTSANTLLTAFLQYKGVFLPQIVLGYGQNIIIICFVIAGALVNEKIIIFGLFISYILMNLMLTKLASRCEFKRRYRSHDKYVAKQILALSLPVFIGGYVAQINTYVDKALASNLDEGSVAALNYALLIIGLITGLTASIISTITFPKLNQAKAIGDQEQFNRLLSKSFNLTAMISIPFGIGAMAFADEVVQVIYERGVFDETATTLTSIALFWYAPHLIASTLNTQIVQAFHANKDMKTPVYIGTISVVLNIILNLVLVKIMGLAGLAFATSIVDVIGLIMRYFALKYKFPQIQLIESTGKLIKVFTAAAISVGVSVVLYNFLIISIWMPRTLYLLISVAIAGVIYLGLLVLLEIDEVKLIKSVVNK